MERRKKQVIPKILIKKESENEDSSSDSSSVKSEREPDTTDLENPHITVEEIENIVGMKINDPFWYRRALTHKSIQGVIKHSYCKNVQEYMKESNERLEFLGDIVFGSSITYYLFNKYPKKNEGFLTKVRTRIVKASAMEKFAEKIGIKGKILMSQYVIKNGGLENKRFLEDAFEAMVGAIRLDIGLDAAHDFSMKIIEKCVNEDEILKDDNYKDLLLRFAQFKKIDPPVFDCIEIEGPPHKRTFTIELRMYERIYGKAKGKTKKRAEQLASKQAINILGITEDIFNGER